MHCEYAFLEAPEVPECDGTYEGSCYQIFSENLHFWNEAHLACGEWGGYLVEITSSKEQAAVASKYPCPSKLREV